MPKNPVTDPITDKEIAFAHLILSGTMNDRDAAESVGLNPDTAAYTKAKPRVQAYMLEQRAVIHKERVQQEAEQLRRQNLVRDQVLVRLWEIAKLSHEATRNSVTGQMKALSLIISIEGLIPDRRAGSAEKKPAEPPANIWKAPWLIEAQQKAAGTWISPDPIQDEDDPAPTPTTAAEDTTSDPNSSPEPDADSGKREFTRPATHAETTPWAFRAHSSASTPDETDPFSTKRDYFPRGY